MYSEQYSSYDDGRLAQLKTPPHSQEAEEAVLSALMMDNAFFETVFEILSSTDFYFHNHKEIYNAISQQGEQGAPFDFITVIALLDTSGRLEEAGGEHYIRTHA